MIVVILLVMTLLMVRLVELLLFIKKISEVCNTYDWKYIDKHGYPLIDVMGDDKYYLESEWSAYNFMFMKGPNPIFMLFSLKALTIEKQYNEDVLNKLREYEVI